MSRYAAVLLVGLAVLAYCWITPSRRRYLLGFGLLTIAAAGELMREIAWPDRGTPVGMASSIIDLGLVAAGLFIVMSRWRNEKRST